MKLKKYDLISLGSYHQYFIKESNVILFIIYITSQTYIMSFYRIYSYTLWHPIIFCLWNTFCLANIIIQKRCTFCIFFHHRQYQLFLYRMHLFALCSQRIYFMYRTHKKNMRKHVFAVQKDGTLFICMCAFACLCVCCGILLNIHF